MKKASFLPILLGSDENAYGCARIFYEKYGIKPLLLCARPLPPTAHSRILTLRVIKDLDSYEVFKSVVGELLPMLKERAEKLLLIPCSDYYAELTVKNRELISAYCAAPVPSEEVYGKISGKKRFYALCAEMGIPYPETAIMTAEELLSCSPFSSPVVIKPENSNSYSYLHLDMKNRKKVYFCNGADDVKTVAEGLFRSGYRDTLVVQRYIPGDRALVINAYCDSKGRVRLIGAAEPLLEYRSPSLIGNYAVLRTVKAREACDTAIGLLEGIGYVGFANFDLKLDEGRGKYVFFELNPRPGRSSYYMRAAGNDLMSALCDDAVFGKGYSGVTYAEREGIWRSVPRPILVSRTSLKASEILRSRDPLAPPFDLLPMRAYTLLKRALESGRLLNEK